MTPTTERWRSCRVPTILIPFAGSMEIAEGPSPDRLAGGHAESDDVDVAEGLLHEGVEPLAEQRARAVHARRVDDDQLPGCSVHDSADRAPRGPSPRR